MYSQWNHKIFGVKKDGFEALALEIFHFQRMANPVYRKYIEALQINAESIDSIYQIPYLPIHFFKSHSIQTDLLPPEAVFESSGTTRSINSRHLVKNLSMYEESFEKGFEFFYRAIKDYCIIGLLPSYVERKNSSLVYMVDKMVQLSKHPQSGFYPHEYEKLFNLLIELEKKKQKTLLIGVTFALLDFAEKFAVDNLRMPLQHIIFMETGGMKGRRKEMIRQEVHDKLKKAFNCSAIHSEYGMTELLSQAYSKGEGVFHCPPWMKISIRDDEDPFSIRKEGSGVINVIDFANISSCSFIATDDAGKVYADGSFEVLGRIDGSDLRGCSLMVL